MPKIAFLANEIIRVVNLSKLNRRIKPSETYQYWKKSWLISPPLTKIIIAFSSCTALEKGEKRSLALQITSF